ncbi:MAG: HAD hydrolase-like protein [Pirellulales bacterium]
MIPTLPASPTLGVASFETCSDDAVSGMLRRPYAFGAARVEWDIVAPRHARAIVFAFDGVLCDLSGWLRWAHTMLPKFGVRCGFAEFRRVWERRWRRLVAVRAISLEAAVDECLAYWLIPAGAIPELRAAIVSQARRERAECRLLPGVKSTLRALQTAGWTLGLYAESPETAAELKQRLDDLDVAECFAVIQTAGDTECSLGDEAAFHVALAGFEVEESAAVFVGAVERDLDTAEDLGWWTVSCATHEHADRRVCERLTDLPGKLPVTTPELAAG